MMRRWRPGDQVVLREVWQGRVWSVKPVIVVRDMPELLALYWAKGTPWKRPGSPDGRPLRLPCDEWVLLDDEMPEKALRLTTPGAAHSVLALFGERGELWCWYVNLEEPQRRTPIGFGYMDQTLDIIVSPDLSRWWWKDEEEFAEAQARGIYSPEEAAAIRAEGERVLKVVSAGGPPFDQGWERWKPDPEWPVPRLPRGWEVLGE